MSGVLSVMPAWHQYRTCHQVARIDIVSLHAAACGKAKLDGACCYRSAIAKELEEDFQKQLREASGLLLVSCNGAACNGFKQHPLL